MNSTWNWTLTKKKKKCWILLSNELKLLELITKYRLISILIGYRKSF